MNRVELQSMTRERILDAQALIRGKRWSFAYPLLTGSTQPQKTDGGNWMSGPIVRKYGFPNFEKIFGERELKHGAEDEAARADAVTPAADPTRTAPTTGSEARPEAEPKKP